MRRRGSHPLLGVSLGLLLVAGLGFASPSQGEEEERGAGVEGDAGPFECPARALVAEDDAGLLRVYDGIRKGLEQAHLPRVCREDLDGTGEVLDRLEKEPPVLLFVIGRVAAQRLGKRLTAVPRVYVDTAWDVNGEEFPPAPEPVAPAAVVRSVLKPVHVAEILRELTGGRPAGRLSWEASTPALETLAEDVALAAGFRPATGEEPGVLLHLRFGMGETPAPLSGLLERARAERRLLLSDDVGHWRRGVPVLLLPDHRLLGRIAADAGRRLLAAPDPPRVILERVAVSELRVDLNAARDLGLDLPVPFLAGADVLRGPRRAEGR